MLTYLLVLVCVACMSLIIYITFPAKKHSQNQELIVAEEDASSDVNDCDSRMLNMIESQPSMMDEAESIIRSYVSNYQPFLVNSYQVSDLAEALGMSKNVISVVLNQQMGVSFSSYFNTLRVRYAMEYMKAHPDVSVEQAAFASGFSSAQTFSRWFKEVNGLTPVSWKKLDLSFDLTPLV